jgi:hypothetical protein
MAEKDTKPDMASPAPRVHGERHVYGPRPVGALVTGVTRPAFKGQSTATAQIMIDWAIIIGPALAAVTAPKRLSGNTLTIACSGPIAMELQHLASEVVNRINSHLGQPIVRSLRFVQIAMLAPSNIVPPPPSRAVTAANEAVAHLPPGDLRDALASVGSFVMSAKKPSTTRLK